ncbi:aldo/keto reductase [Agrobacterium pusense]|uniref:aldo/keto reductase n=1 Tax=Agrobacterium pusense TaxID=648995 RepID=UPI002448B20E|nr:aldo/keto reductase [Agrobacterium pusense]MDH0872738.1 aldo/keto reductase [Agrobacterium pusense]
MKVNGTEVAPLGMGCWPIGGPMFGGPGLGNCGPLGYANSDDAESVRTIHAALANGIRLFDTAAVYGAGHAEQLLAKALRGRSDAVIVTKIGISIDEESKMLLGEDADPASVLPAIDRCLTRLNRDRIDILLLHLNDLPVSRAEPMFEAMAHAVTAGKIGGYGWSTDLPTSVKAMIGRQDFIAVEHAMNILLDAPVMQRTIEENELVALIRSPLGMGVLTGKYDAQSQIPATDIRAVGNTVTAYFKDGRPNPGFLQKLDSVRELLQTDGRSLVQGALGWLWAKSDRNIPVPGARTIAQIEGIAEALTFGPLPLSVVSEIDDLIGEGEYAAEDQPR